jgi:hypothetical protein
MRAKHDVDVFEQAGSHEEGLGSYELFGHAR